MIEMRDEDGETADGSLVCQLLAHEGNDPIAELFPEGEKVETDEFKSILAEADSLVNVDRQAQYGHPLDNWSMTAQIWTSLLQKKLNHPITAEEACVMMAAMKLAREVFKHKRDNLVDCAGYSKCAQLCHEERQRRNPEKCS